MKKDKPLNADREWISRESLPQILTDFNTSSTYDSMRSRIENVEYAINDASKKREEEEGERGSAMVKAQQPMLEMKPPPNIRDPVIRETFNAGWLKEQHAAAMKAVQTYEQSQQKNQDYQHNQTKSRSSDYEYTR